MHHGHYLSIAIKALPALSILTLLLAATLMPSANAYSLAKFEPPGDYVYSGVGTRTVELQDFIDAAGKAPALRLTYYSFGVPFPNDPSSEQSVRGILNAGMIPILTWEPSSVSLTAIASGSQDAYINSWAQAARAECKPIFLRFAHEMNGNWYPWGSSRTPAAGFAAAWRHIHGLFRQAGASNVIWMWNPNIVNTVPQVRLRPLYPGNAYVDWVGITGYFPTTGPHTYAGLYGPTMREIRQFTRKPVIIAETSVETGPGEVTSAAQLVGTATRHGAVGFIWFDYRKDGVDWRAESRPILRAALARDLAPVRLASLTRY
jgi:hypothetical protein